MTRNPPPHPTLAQLRARVHKERHREIGNWLACHVARPTAVYGTWLAVRIGLSANQVTALAMTASLASALGFGLGTRTGFVAGVILALLAFWLDRVDGQVARWNRSASLDGVYLDYLMHHVANLCLGFGLGYGLTTRTGDPRWSLAGFAAAGGWCLLNLHNDCRYKAFFQRLKRESRVYRVDGGSGGRPAPPARFPGLRKRSIVWLAYKTCEPHIILIGLSVLALLGLLAPALWLAAWKASLALMALLAPTLALARVARAARRGAVEQEFATWFQESRDDLQRLPEQHDAEPK